MGLGEVNTQIIVAYNLCEPGKNSKGTTVFEQQEGYFEERGVFTSPRTLFYEQLINQMVEWKQGGDELVLFGEFNENMYTGRFARRLPEEDLLMTEQCLKTTGEQLPSTCVREGNNAIDACFATEGAKCMTAGILSKYGGVGSVLHTGLFLGVQSGDLDAQNCSSKRKKTELRFCKNKG